METHFLLAFGEEEFLAPFAMTGSEAFFNKLLGLIEYRAKDRFSKRSIVRRTY
jgi:hypothetical protein